MAKFSTKVLIVALVPVVSPLILSFTFNLYFPKILIELARLLVIFRSVGTNELLFKTEIFSPILKKPNSWVDVKDGVSDSLTIIAYPSWVKIGVPGLFVKVSKLKATTTGVACRLDPSVFGNTVKNLNPWSTELNPSPGSGIVSSFIIFSTNILSPAANGAWSNPNTGVANVQTTLLFPASYVTVSIVTPFVLSTDTILCSKEESPFGGSTISTPTIPPDESFASSIPLSILWFVVGSTTINFGGII